VITAIVDEDQLSLAIGRNGQNVRLASQLIGWQIDLYGSREWLERGADMSVFAGQVEDQYETADFPLSELDLPATTLAALGAAGYETFLQIIDLERRDFLGIEGIGEEDADRLLQLIDELTVVEGEPSTADDDDVVASAGGEDDDAVGATMSEDEDRESAE
jgi:transcription termination/antitermination protein NusA